MKNTLHKLLCGILFTLSFQAQAQDIHFSQFFEAPLLRNPALAGIFSGDFRLQTVHRTQWQSVTVPYQTTSLNGEVKLGVGKSADFLTIGAQVLYDKAGTIAMTATHIQPALNYHKSLSADRNMYLSLGFMGGIVQRKLDRSKVTTNSQFDGTAYNGNLADGETFANSSYSYFDGTAGISFNTQLGPDAENNLFAGLAYHHFNKTAKASFYGNTNLEMTPKWVASVGAKMAATDFTSITIHTDYSKQGSYSELIGGAMLSYQLDDTEDPRYFIHAGGFMRFKDALVPVAKLEVKPLAISVSYDANISQLSSASSGKGGFELGISYQKYLKRDNTSKEAVRCPRF
ncbi:MAG: PorP/SprF family type IX secretion system membrane protein [Ferruginibacter sp.]|nr:PorP/SprF family type IX secretion system membrane protein [Ferruginibacter sp.]